MLVRTYRLQHLNKLDGDTPMNRHWQLCTALLLTLIAQRVLAEEAPPNTLTNEEKKAGFKLLFDGRTTDGWRGYKMPLFTPWPTRH